MVKVDKELARKPARAVVAFCLNIARLEMKRQKKWVKIVNGMVETVAIVDTGEMVGREEKVAPLEIKVTVREGKMS